jgi:hypothetical protein
MKYLGHNEFGLNHKPWNDPINYQDRGKIDYWLEQWSLFYKEIYNKYQSYMNCYFVLYEELANANYIKTLLKKINFSEFENINLNFFKNSNKKEIERKYSLDKYKKTIEIYNNFKD